MNIEKFANSRVLSFKSLTVIKHFIISRTRNWIWIKFGVSFFRWFNPTIPLGFLDMWPAVSTILCWYKHVCLSVCLPAAGSVRVWFSVLSFIIWPTTTHTKWRSRRRSWRPVNSSPATPSVTCFTFLTGCLSTNGVIRRSLLWCEERMSTGTAVHLLTCFASRYIYRSVTLTP